MHTPLDPDNSQIRSERSSTAGKAEEVGRRGRDGYAEMDSNEYE
jgi:hypothetical protein